MVLERGGEQLGDLGLNLVALNGVVEDIFKE
jgi:hypothetical protein